MVIMDTSDYVLEIKTILSNPATYSPIPSDPSLDINTNLNVLLLKLFKAKTIDENLFKAIRNEPEDIICPHFYGLPKVHKPTLPNHSLPPFRGIISSIHGPNTRASIWLDSILNPLVAEYCGSEYCRDSLHMLSDLSLLNSSQSFPSSEYCLVTIDVVDMYNSIPHADGVLACRDALLSLTDFSPSQVQLITDLISFILENNCFTFDNCFFQQVKGTAMGSPFAPAYANLFMAHFWRNMVSPVLPFSPVFFRRYIDDMFSIFDHDIDVDELTLFLNSLHPTVKFTLSSPSDSVPFLDLRIHIRDSTLHTDLYSKPTDSHLFLSPTSNHPRHTFHSIVYGSCLRLLRICSLQEYLLARVTDLFSFLIASGYKASFIKPIFSVVLSKSREQVLSKAPVPPKSERIVFVSTYHPQMPNLHARHANNAGILAKSERMSEVLPARPLVAYRRTPNLQNLLIKTKPKSSHSNTLALSSSLNLSSPSSNSSVPTNNSQPLSSLPPPGCHPCQRANCGICKTHLIPGDTITSTVTGHTHKIRQHIHCNTSNLIYVITCNKCKKQYTGQTSNKLRIRINNHKSAIRRQGTEESVGLHFQSEGHSVNDLRVQVVELIPPGPDQKRRLDRAESFWMRRLQTHSLTGGLNLDEPFLTNLTLSN